MKQSKVKDYRPNYPKKLLKGAILTTAAAVALTGATGCNLQIMGKIAPEPVPTDELVLDGEIAVDPGEEELALEGEPAVDENGDIIMDGEDESNGRGEPALQGKIVVPEDTPEP
jgi:hypothetical protein